MIFNGAFNPQILIILQFDSQLVPVLKYPIWDDYSEAEYLWKGKAHQIIRERCIETG